MSKPNKNNGFQRSVIWMLTTEHNDMIDCAKVMKTSKSKFARSAIRREVARQKNIAKTKT